MHRITLSIILLFSATAVVAAWYQKIDGTIVDPIQSVNGGDLSYSGSNVEPGAVLIDADLNNATLNNATLTGAIFTNANLTGANFTGAIGAPSTSSQLALTPLDETIIGGAQLHEANFSGADLSGAIFDHENDAYDAVGWELAIWTGAHFHYLNQPLFPTGMIHTDHGIVVRTPEPSTLLLALLGLTLVPRRRRR